MKRKCAALTIAHNEPDFLKMWYRYISKHFDDQDIHILDDRNSEGYLDDIGGVHHALVGSELGYAGDSNLRIAVNMRFIELLKDHDYVLYCDSDMFVVPDPEKYPGGLSEYIDQFDETFAHCAGYHVVSFDEDPLVVDQQPWLAQRTYWHRDWVHLCKVTLAREDPQYKGGFHGSKWNTPRGTEIPSEQEKDELRLIHMGWACTELVKRRWSNRIASEGYKKMWDPSKAYENVWGVAHDPKFPRQLIPDSWKAAL